MLRPFESLDEKRFDATKFEDIYVHQVYDEIALEFSFTRHTPWPGVMKFIKSQETKLGADIGCGNGKYLVAFAKILNSPDSIVNTETRNDLHFVPLFGLERCEKLANIVSDRGGSAVVGDVLKIPFASYRLDYFICIAVIHHLSTLERRVQAIAELSRILRVGGKGLIQVWAKEQYDVSGTNPSHYVARKAINYDKDASQCNQGDCEMVEVVPGVRLPIHVPKTQFRATDMLVPWKQKKDNLECTPPTWRGRFYHLFVQGELDDLIHQVDGLQIDKSYYEQGNWVVQLTKTF